MIGPKHDQPLGKAAIGQCRALQPRQGLGAKRLLDHVELPRRRLWRQRCGARLHRFRRVHRRIATAARGRMKWLLFRRDVLGNIGERQIAPLLRLGIRPLLLRLAFRRRGSLGGRSACLLLLELIFENGLGEFKRRLQARHFEQHDTRTREIGLDKAAGIGGRIDEIARGATARTEPEPVERHQRISGIAGHRIFL